jgi:hypothetical protein
MVCTTLTRSALRRQSFHAWMASIPQSLCDLRMALRDVTYAFTGRARDDVDGGVAPSPLTSAQVVIVLGVFAAETMALLAASVWFLFANRGLLGAAE